MKGIERTFVALAFLMTGVLIFVSVSRSRGKTAGVPVADTGDCKTVAATQAVAASSQKRPPSSFVANPFCEACHADFAEEELVSQHKLFGIGCERCHGESLRHRSDEANVTPPEIMYPKEKINPACMMCHPRYDIDYLADHRPIMEAGLSIFDAQPSGPNGKNYCTDCHGLKHRMNTRTIHWDKSTGALLQKSN
jgi:hypothetical protein